MQRIKAHSEDIQAVCWAPTPRNPFLSEQEQVEVEDVDNPEKLFAVASRERRFSVWSAKTGMQVASIMLAADHHHSKEVILLPSLEKD